MIDGTARIQNQAVWLSRLLTPRSHVVMLFKEEFLFSLLVFVLVCSMFLLLLGCQPRALRPFFVTPGGRFFLTLQLL